MASKVWLAQFDDQETDDSIVRKAAEVFEKAGMTAIAREDKSCAIKTHFGEPGDNSYLPPHFIQPFVDQLKEAGSKPVFVETSTLYSGQRSNAVDHFHTAVEHGFGYENTGCPVTFVDGMQGNYHVEVDVDLKHFDRVAVAGDFPLIPSVLVVSHLTGHELGGIGGAIKNVAMGLTSRSGKMRQHDAGKPKVDEDECVACGTCARWCPVDAIEVPDVATIDYETCIACGECLAVCPVDAIGFEWSEKAANFSEQMAEYACGILQGKESTAGFVTFIHHTTKECNCPGKKMDRICPDLGILASFDPVAIDQAAVDLVNESAGKDVFQAMWPNTSYQAQLEHGDRIGLGTREYELIRL